ncbi:MAG: hypothetical protein L0154_17805 [Chloroflexi bacterium]|nr:hypothetical protein [Chloroflexota bacterium]
MIKCTRQPRILLLLIAVIILALAGCGEDDEVPPTEIVVITNTPGSAPVGDNSAELEATINSLAQAMIDQQATIEALNAQLGNGETTPNPTQISQQTLDAVQQTATVAPTPTDLPSIFPTPRIEQAIVVEQVFEQGRMFWFRDWRRIWVAVGDDTDPMSGDWFCFEDTFEEGDIESVEELNPPEDYVTESEFANAQPQQPIRGFGKVWRENEELREQLGWALTSETEHSTRRDYIAGGVLDENEEYVPGPGEWRVTSFYDEVFTFLEAELGQTCPSGRWRSRDTN